MAITKEAIAAARAAAKEVGPCAVAARYRPSVGKLEVEFINGVTLAVPTSLIQQNRDHARRMGIAFSEARC